MRHRRFDWVKFFVITGLIVLIIGAIRVYAKKPLTLSTTTWAS